jgi:hypothetical protein
MEHSDSASVSSNAVGEGKGRKSESSCVAIDPENGTSLIQAVLFGITQVNIQMKHIRLLLCYLEVQKCE